MASLQHVHAHCEMVAFEYCSFNKDIYDGEFYIKERVLKPVKQALKNVRDSRPIIAGFFYKFLTDKKNETQMNSSQQNTGRIYGSLCSDKLGFCLGKSPFSFPLGKKGGCKQGMGVQI